MPRFTAAAAAWVAAPCLVASCLIYGDDLLIGAGVGGAGGGTSAGGDGAGGASSTGGGGDRCGGCPEPADECVVAACRGSSCGESDAPAGDPCSDGVCDGNGACVECLEEGHCPDRETCAVEQICVTPGCDNGATDGSETDVDCGGDCAPALTCADGEGCGIGADCESGVCTGDVCQAPSCGDGALNVAGEQCDEGDVEPYDGCSPSCLTEVDNLIFSEIVVKPTAAEFIEIYNPTAAIIDLSKVYIADYNPAATPGDRYYLVTQGGAGNPGQSSDFRVTFPNGAMIGPGEIVVISTKSATEFQTSWGSLPDFDFDASDAGAPTMLGDLGAPGTLTDGGEMLVLFYWDQTSDLVVDLDYLVWGTSADHVDKTGVTVGASTYAADTPAASQTAAPTPDGTSESLQRCDTAESSETMTGGNGLGGDDETSEDAVTAWRLGNTPSPGAAPPVGYCQ